MEPDSDLEGRTSETREIPINYASDAAGDIAEAVGEAYSPGEYIQSIQVKEGKSEFTAIIKKDYAIMQAAKDALLEHDDDMPGSDFSDVPDDPDSFHVTSVELEVEDIGYITIALFGDDHE